MEKNVRISWLLDFYGALLTERQRLMLSLHYNDDLSLGEIAEQEGISRQGVHDAIRRGEAFLEETESKLKLLERHIGMTTALGRCVEWAKTLSNDRADDTALKYLTAMLQRTLDEWEDPHGF